MSESMIWTSYSRLQDLVGDGQVQDEDVPGCLGDFIPQTRKQYCKISAKSKRKDEAINNQENVVCCRGYSETRGQFKDVNKLCLMLPSVFLYSF